MQKSIDFNQRRESVVTYKPRRKSEDDVIVQVEMGSATKSDCEFVVVEPNDDDLNSLNQTMPLQRPQTVGQLFISTDDQNKLNQTVDYPVQAKTARNSERGSSSSLRANSMVAGLAPDEMQRFQRESEVTHYEGFDPSGKGEFQIKNNYQVNELATSYNVKSFVKMNERYEYRLLGTDPKTKKIFDVMRRYPHFLLLRVNFILRFPGMYIPPLPKKQTIDSQEKIANLRKFFLNRFVKQISMCPYLLESQEFQVFLKPQVNLEVELN